MVGRAAVGASVYIAVGFGIREIVASLPLAMGIQLMIGGSR